MARINRLCDI